MMRTLLRIMAAATLLLVIKLAPAQQITTIGKEVPDIKLSLEGEGGQHEIYLFRELRGSIAVFYFWRSANLESLQRLSEIGALYQKYGNKGVRFISVTADNKERAEKATGEGNFEPFRWRFMNSPGLYYHLGAFSDPYVVLVDPLGAIAWRGVPSDRLEERIEDLYALTPPLSGDEEWLARQERQAERFFEQGEFGRAYSIARRLFRMTDESQPAHGRAEALVGRCEAAAGKWLEDAIRLESDKEYEKAARIVAEIATRFEDPDEGRDNRSGSGGGGRDDQDQNVKRRAEGEIGRMNGNRELKKLIRDARENAEGELLNDEAAGLEEDDYYVRAKHIYEQVIKEHKDTPAAKEAKKRLETILRDKTIQKKIAERRAREQAYRWLDIGDRYVEFKFTDEAREQYQRIIDEHPETFAAGRAKERLAELPEPAAKAEASSDKPAAEARP